MQRVVTTCDVCGTGVAVKSYRINLGCSMDPSGNGYNTDWDYKDYCDQCLAMVKASDKELKIHEC